jgi:hypothetical protein
MTGLVNCLLARKVESVVLRLLLFRTSCPLIGVYFDGYINQK